MLSVVASITRLVLCRGTFEDAVVVRILVLLLRWNGVEILSLYT